MTMTFMEAERMARGIKTVYTVHVNGAARYHGIRREDAQDIAWAHLLNGESVEVQENPWQSQ
jgi:hypothetical protein